MPGPVALTGATGFIGSTLLNLFIREGREVRALTRRPRATTDRVTWIRGDLDDRQALLDLVSGAEAIVHCAGTVRGNSRESFFHTNVTGTRNLVEAASGSPSGPAFLLMSSLAAREPALSWYASSKREAETVVSSNAGGLPWAALRPTAVYGPGDREISPVLKLTRYGLLPMAGRNRNRFGLLHVEDLAGAVLHWLKTEQPCEGIFEIDDGTPGGYDRYSLAGIAAEVWNRPVRPVALPETLIYTFAGLNLTLSRVLHYSPMLTPGKVRELLHHDWVCDNRPLIQALPGWRPEIQLRDALPGAVSK